MGLFDAFKIKMILKKIKSTSESRVIKISPTNSYKSTLIISDQVDESFNTYLATVFEKSKFTTLSNRKEKKDDSSANHYTYHISDLGFGNIKNDRLLNLLNTQFDLVIDISIKTKELNYFVKNSKSSLKIGDLNASKNYLYDLLVDEIDSKTEFIDNIKRQINILSQS